MSSPVQLHREYDRQEKGRLRRLARQEVPEVTTTAPASRGGRKPFAVRVPPEVARQSYPRRVRAAAALVVLCARDLGIETPPLRFLLRVSPAQAGDLVRKGLAEEMDLRRIDTSATGLCGGAVWVELSRPAEAVARTAAHETRHAAQEDRADDRAEPEARAYAEEALRRFWPIVRQELDDGPAESG